MKPDNEPKMTGTSTSIEISDCLQRVTAAEEALGEVRNALMTMVNAASSKHGRQQAQQTQQAFSRNSPSQDKPLMGAAGSSPLPPSITNSERQVPAASENARHSTTSQRVELERAEMDKLGGVEAVAKKLKIKPEDAEKCLRAFAGCDVEGKGKISAAELNVLMENACGMRFSHQEIEQIMQKYDKDGTDDLSFEEFLVLFCETPLFKAKDLDDHMSRVGQEIRQQMEEERMTPLERADGLGVSAKAIKNYLRKEIAEAGACFQMPIAALLFAFFILAVFWHMRIEELHAMDTAFTWDLYENANFAWSGEIPFENGRMGHKNLGDVNSIADFWSWFNLGLVPLFWPEGWDVSEVRANMGTRCMGIAEALESFGWNRTVLAGMPKNSTWGGICPENLDPVTLPKELWGGEGNATLYLYFNTIIGGMRMQQESSTKQPCPAPDKELKKSVRSTSCLRDLGYWLEPELRSTLRTNPENVNHSGSETQYLLSRTSQTKIRERLRELENRAWLNPRTAKVDLMFTTYNPHLDLLTATYIFLFLNRGGHIHKVVEPVSVWLHPYHGWWNYVVDISWCVITFCIMCFELVEVFKHLWQLGLRRGAVVYFKFTNAIDWLSICYSSVIIYLWFDHLGRLETIRSLLRRGDVALVGTWADEQDRMKFFDAVADMMDRTYWFRAVLAWYPFVIISRLFKAFAHQPRLALVTNTIGNASTDIIHFAVVFSSIFLIYATSAMILFGQEILHFANLGRSMASIFRILLGEFNWDDMNRVGRLRANLWFWTFIWLVQLTMLNMLLAIVMDVYTEVKGSLGTDAETMWSQAMEIYHRIREVQAGRQLHLDYILQKIDPTDLDAEDDEEDGVLALEFYTASRFCQAVPGLREEQARHILIAAQSRYEEQGQTSTSLTDTALTVQKMAGLLWKLHAAVQELFHMGEMNAHLMLSATEASGHMAVFQNSKQVQREEKQDIKHVANRDAVPSLQVLSSLLDNFHRQHRETQELLRHYGEILTSTISTASLRQVPELHPPEPESQACKNQRPLFGNICTSPEIFKKGTPR